MRRNVCIAFYAFTLVLFTFYSYGQVNTVTVSIPKTSVKINENIYGQMLENVADSMIYGGLRDLQGNARPVVDKLLKDLDIPVMRWPGGTVIHEYHWKNGVGPRTHRPLVALYSRNSKENYQFGTDEFLQWCELIGTVPYVNFNMGNDLALGGTLEEALEWMDYVYSDDSTPMGRLRIRNGRKAPYPVKYWGIGNENYESWGKHTKETPAVYGEKLAKWATAMKARYPDAKLMGVGYGYLWDLIVLQRSGSVIDYLNQHYYVSTLRKEGVFPNPYNSLFAPLKMEAHISKVGGLLDKVNDSIGRNNNPIMLAIDEWNNRHNVFKDSKFTLDRQDPRTQLDVAVAAGMLNVFIRQSQYVGMANYIFPVNAHGMIRTVGNDDAYITPLYPLFKQYRQWMLGERLDAVVKGNGFPTDSIKPRLDGDARDVKLNGPETCFVDAAATLHDGVITVSLVNRNVSKSEKVTIKVPKNYVPHRKWALESPGIYTVNDAEGRNNVKETVTDLNARQKAGTFTTDISACGTQLIQFIIK